jgi:O-methyltransferase
MIKKVFEQAKQLAQDLIKKPSPAPTKKYPQDFSPEDISEVEAATPYTMTSPERLYALRRAVEYITRANIPGEIVECGVWKGGSMMATARALVKLQATQRKLFLFDTFEGMTPPQEVDRSVKGQSALKMLETEPKDGSWFWAIAPLDGVKQVMQSTGYPSENINYVKGPVEETIPEKAPEKIALLRLDTDWFQSTYHEMTHLYPRLVAGGVLIIDDYGYWEGARRAIDQYFAEKNLMVLLHRIDDTGRMLVKAG